MTALIEHHLAAIPFENIDVLLGRDIDIEPEAIDAKLIDRERGGYCFEHNNLFARVLEALGFEVDRLAARVTFGRAPDAPPLPRTHMTLRVESEGRHWLVDVGFGGVCPIAPLALDTAEPQPTSLETFRVLPGRDGWIAEFEADGAWRGMYEVSPERLGAIDYAPLNWFTSTHPESIFKHHLMAAIVTRGARHGLLDNRLTTRHADGTQTSRTLDADELARVLVEPFGLTIEPEWRALIERLARDEAEAPRV
ncbi:arylamine N-acetyltransferase [Pararobbsia silviterrae]|uniref:Arylamine N-acetyltransferase n=1 Tax=Pararobbsia silviterrae TaxID=1792498 RepID=A0A494Y806_9BURK|nr:arylamine N-acetyltransferase [Pararobbsia silviterrae]